MTNTKVSESYHGRENKKVIVKVLCVDCECGSRESLDNYGETQTLVESVVLDNHMHKNYKQYCKSLCFKLYKINYKYGFRFCYF